MPFAVIKTGGKQYIAEEGKTLLVEKLSSKDNELKPGDKVTFNDVLLVDDGAKTMFGTPTISGATVVGELINEQKGKKLTIVKFKSKTRFRRKQGHRQIHAKVKVLNINV